MNYFLLSPEVAGGLGKNTVMNRTVHPPAISRLHYELDGWLGDELLESFPCFVVTRRLADAIENAGLSGVSFGDLEVTTSEQFKELYPDRDLPQFVWMKVMGKAGKQDFGLDDQNRLIASEKALDVLKTMRVDNCDTSEYRL